MKKTVLNSNQKKTNRQKRRAAFLRHKICDATEIKNHLASMNNETIRKALIANGIYDLNMKLTASFR